MTSWDPELYLDFADHRARPYHDLLNRVGARTPREVVDLGCGPGNLTAVLATRWPAASLRAVDSSAEMVAAARARAVPAEQLDVSDWDPGPRTDVVVTNSVLQWVPGHPDLLRRWTRALPVGAWFAMQVPGNLQAPSHEAIRQIADLPRWRGSVVLRDGPAVAQPQEYAQLLSGAGLEADVWETTYLHRLSGPDPVLHWISGTALRPVRDALSATDYEAFVSDLAPLLQAAYPAGPDGSTWFPFRRIFAVAHRMAADEG